MTITPLTTAPASMPRFGHAQKPVAFGTARKKEGETTKAEIACKATTAQRKTLGKLFKEASIPANLAFKINTVDRPDLLTAAGGVKVTVDVLKAATQHLGNPANRAVYVLTDYPDAKTVKQARANIATMNRLIEPKGFKDKLLARAYWSLVGVQCPMQPVDFVVNPDKPLQGAFRIPFCNVPQSSITKMSEALAKMRPELLNFLEKMGI